MTRFQNITLFGNKLGFKEGLSRIADWAEINVLGHLLLGNLDSRPRKDG